MYGSLFYVLPILAVIAKTVFRAVLPLLIGCMIAYVVNILMCFYEKGYARICRMAAIAPLQRPLCMTLSYLSLVLVILILWWMIVPQLLSCIRIIATDFPQVLELLCEWANEHLQMDLGMGNEIRAWMNEPFCWDTLIAKIPRLAKGMKTSLEKLGSWLLIFLPGLMFSFYLLAAKESLLRMGSSLIDRCFGVFQGKKIRYVEGVKHSEDLLFGAQMMYMANSFFYMKSQYFYHYNCWNNNSATHTFHKDKWDNYKKLYEETCCCFKNCEEYEFDRQLNLLLLFFVYNAVGDILETQIIDRKDKRKIIKEILSDDIVYKMFQEIRISRLKISKKLKIQTYLYKYKRGITLLIIWHQRKNKNISNYSNL